MKIAVVYVYAGKTYENYALRFLQTYNQFPAALDHESIVVCNGIRATSETECLFSSLRNCRLIEHDNSGYDIGAYQLAARTVPCDVMLFFGASTYIRGAGWLLPVANSFKRHGNALYGVMGNGGDMRVNVFPHIRTTGFWLPPSLLNQYPVKVTRPEQRFPFEHGSNCLTQWTRNQGLGVWLVTWQGDYPMSQSEQIPNGFHRGNQSALLFGDRLSEPPFYAVP